MLILAAALGFVGWLMMAAAFFPAQQGIVAWALTSSDVRTRPMSWLTAGMPWTALYRTARVDASAPARHVAKWSGIACSGLTLFVAAWLLAIVHIAVS